MTDSSSPRPVEVRPRAPWPIRLLWGVVKGLVLVFIVTWLMATIAFNFFLKGALEQQLSDRLGKKVTFAAMRAGWNLARPTLAVMDAKVWNDAKTYEAKVGTLEFGFFLDGSKVDDNMKDILFYAGVDGLELGGKPFGDYHVKMRADTAHGNDDISIEELNGEYRGAKIKGTGSDHKNHLTANISAENVDYSLLAEGVKGGKAHVKLDVTTTGVENPSPEIIKNLNGHATLIGGAGSLEGNALNVWAGSLLTAFLPGQSKDTHLNCAVAEFDIKNGVAHSKTGIIDTDKATITGTGTVDLVRQRMDMRFTPRTKGLAVLSLATPVIVSGPFGNITTHPDATGVAEKMGGFLLSTVVAPAALLPFLHSNGNSNPCQKFLETGDK